jgi:hypothetical protein
MSCVRCASERLKNFNAEVAVHFPGWEGLAKPAVFVFPKLLVCLGCGLVQFELASEQLAQLKSDDLAAQSRKRTRAS